MEIKVCGPGCANCTKAENIVQEAVADAGIEAEVVKITDFVEMAQLGVLSTPAIVIDGKIMCVGKVPAKSEVLAWIK
ncbi:MAG: TM0996/MTH895 family glutaredoxin-like protein [Deltaproteobacteria bacterium]|jgi:small redox-active disulfide protein 2|nr:TM0996/MTH895 family glutaredoxin-like protein [Deltaproteobacteria bacterium]MBW2484090.1 TM0996/MTH895 family glutaredoxin-like protein [Deltaproteobacteria bacterium]